MSIILLHATYQFSLLIFSVCSQRLNFDILLKHDEVIQKHFTTVLTHFSVKPLVKTTFGLSETRNKTTRNTSLLFNLGAEFNQNFVFKALLVKTIDRLNQISSSKHHVKRPKSHQLAHQQNCKYLPSICMKGNPVCVWLLGAIFLTFYVGSSEAHE